MIGLLSDPHANLPALEAVLRDVERVGPETLICLGDFVGYGAQPNEVVEALRTRCDVHLIGNHDLAALGAIDISSFNSHAAAAARWTASHLTSESRTFLESLEPRGVFRGLHLAHASVRDPVWEYVLDYSTAAANFDHLDFEVAIVGHTHVPAVFVRQSEGEIRGLRVITLDPERQISLPEGRLILNPGGVGQPRDGDPRASWALWDMEERVFTVRRLEYPVDQAQQAIRAAGLPEILAERLTQGW